MEYLFIDTNIFVNCCLLEIENSDDIDALNFLLTTLEENKAQLILPEVVEFEFKKVLKEKTQKLEKKINTHKEAIGKDNDLDKKIIREMINKLDGCIGERKENTNSVLEVINKIFLHRNAIKIPITPEILTGSLKYYLLGEKPNTDDGKFIISSDGLIIQSILSHLKNQNGYTLYFCSFNNKDFASPKSKNSTSSEPLKIHPDIEKDFEKIEYFTNLFELLNIHFGGQYGTDLIQQLKEKELSETSDDSQNNDNNLVSNDKNITSQTIQKPSLNTCITKANVTSIEADTNKASSKDEKQL